MDSVKEVEQIAHLNNYNIAKEIVRYPWGTDEIVIRDPDGLIVVFRELIKT